MAGFTILLATMILFTATSFCRLAHAEETDTGAVRKRAAIKYEDIPRKVLAFYYPWYGTQAFTGSWVHYEDIDTEAKTIASSTHYPSIGPYDSHDPEAVAYHMDMAERAGIDGFIVSWWGQGDFSDNAMPVILDEAQKKGIEVTIYYERVPEEKSERAVDDFLYILGKYGSHPAYQKVGGKPVIFVYGRAMGQLWQRWSDVIRPAWSPSRIGTTDPQPEYSTAFTHTTTQERQQGGRPGRSYR